MQIRYVITTWAACLLVIPAVLGLRLPLAWPDKQAYVANATVNGTATLLQLGTWSSDVWLACARIPGGDCSRTETCDAILTAEGRGQCIVEAPAKIELRDDEQMVKSERTVAIHQYHDLHATDNTSYAPPYSKPDYSSEQPALVATAKGLLGLGLNTSALTLEDGWIQPPALVSPPLVTEFSLFLTSDGDGSIALLGDDASSLSREVQAKNDKLSPYVLSLRHDDNGRLSGWKLSVVAVRFDESKPWYPRVYESDESLGEDATAVLSLNHAVIQFPTAVFNRFSATYLSTCTQSRNKVVGKFYLCEASLLETLPRIGLYLNDKNFFLDPTDYTHVSSSNKSNVVVKLYDSKDELLWVLGAPFLRKFPAHFSLMTKSVELFCVIGSSCTPQTSGVLEREVVIALDTAGSTDSSSERNDSTRAVSRPPYPFSYQEGNLSTGILVVVWIGRCFGCIIVCLLVYSCIRTCRDQIRARRRGIPVELALNEETETVASEKDLEQMKEELRLMLEADENSSTWNSQGSHQAHSVDIDFIHVHSPRSINDMTGPCIGRS